MASYSVNTNPARERAVQWAAKLRNVTADQVVQFILNDAIDVLITERRNRAGSAMLDAFDAGTAEERTTAKTALHLGAEF